MFDSLFSAPGERALMDRLRVGTRNLWQIRASIILDVSRFARISILHIVLN